MKYLFLILSLILFSCSNSEKENDRIVGTCSSPNPAKPSKSEILFDAQGGVDSVTITGWIDEGFDNCRYIYNDYDDCKGNYCFSPGIILKIKCKWFVATRTDETTIHVLVNQNETGEERKHFIKVQRGNCFSGFWIIQSAE
ncbi:MAG: hypothetical protein LBU89_03830 [Fibromonadaceae bacterium]|jgi:hypothetical protein|nr:hypothetical protein [Fibromonadaceae bacterium]